MITVSTKTWDGKIYDLQGKYDNVNMRIWSRCNANSVEHHRRCYESCDQYCKNIMYCLHSFVDDYMEAGSKKDALASQELTHTTICGRRPISEKECILTKNGDLGHSSQLYWGNVETYLECISSLVTLYSPYMRGMRSFVAAINHMTSLASGLHKAKAKPLTCFAMSMRRAAIIMCIVWQIRKQYQCQ